MDPLSASASAAGLLGLVVQLINYAHSVKGAKEERQLFIKELEGLHPLLQRLKTHTDPHEPWTRSAAEVRAILVLLEAQLKAMEPKLRPVEGFRSTMQRVLWPIFDKATFQEGVVNIARYVVQIRTYVGEDHFELSRDTNAVVREGNVVGKETNATVRNIESRIETTGRQTQLQVKEVLADGKENFAAIQALSQDVLLAQKEMRVQADEKERRGISEWLSPHNFLARQKYLFENSYPLGKWLVESEELQLWAKGKPWQLRLWGDAGAGKTRLCSILVNYLQERFDPNTTPVICMYLESNMSRNENQTRADILGGLLKQLIQQKETDVGPEDLRKAYHRDRVRKAKPGYTELRKFLFEEIARYPRVIVVVDALDECNESTRNWLNALLEELQKKPGGRVSILATARMPTLLGMGEITCHSCGDTGPRRPLNVYWRCRDCPEDSNFDICQTCKDKGVTCGNDFHELCEPNDIIQVQVITPPEELMIFVKGEIAKEIGSNTARDRRQFPSQASTSFGARLRNNPKLAEKVVSEIVKRAEGKFIFASLYWDSLKRQRTTAAIEMVLGNFPKSIDKLYDAAMEERILKQDTEENAQLAIKIIQLLCGAKQNLNLEELQHALATEKGDTEFVSGRDYQTQEILDVTKGFVTIDNAEVPAVRLFHATFDAYLWKNRNRWFPEIETMLATLCLTYLNFEPLTHRYRRVREYETTRQEYPFLPYAAQYWGDHAREAAVRKDADLERTVLNYLKDAEKATACMQAAWCGQTHGSTNWELPRSVNGLHIIAWFGLSIPEEEKSLEVDFQEPYSGQTPLMWACQKGHDGVVRQLLSMGADVNLADIHGRTPLWEAVDNRSQEVVLALLKVPELEINAINPKRSNRTALMHASLLGDIEIVRSLLQFPTISVNQQDSEGFTALSTAAAFAQREVIKELISRPDIDLDIVVTSTGRSALTIAALRSHTEEIIEDLLSHGANTTLKDNTGGGTAILRAAESGNLAAVQSMIAHNADYLCVDDSGRTVLQGACSTENADEDVIELLLGLGVSVDVRDNHGCTPLHEASQNGIVAAVEALLAHGADPTLKDNFGRTCYTVALQYAKHDVMDMLKTKLVDIYGSETAESNCAKEYENLPVWALVNLGREDLIDKAIAEKPDSLAEIEPISKDTALHRAVLQYNEDSMLEKLLRHMSPNGRNRNGSTPLHIAAAATGDEEERGTKAKAAALLVQHNAELEQVDMWGGTPLAVAQQYMNFEVAVILIEAGANLFAKRVNVQKLLFEAVKLKDVVAAEKLVSQGNANVMVRNEKGQTALDLAKESGSGEMMQVVKSSSTFYRDPDDDEHEGDGTNKGKLHHGAHSIFPMPDDVRNT